MLRYGVYARKSDDDKSVTEKSISDQLAELSLIMQRDGLNVLNGCTWKESKSAKVPRMRPLYSEMIRLIEEGTIDAILCWHINRLVRNMEEGGKLAQLLIDGKVREIRTPSAIYRTGDNIMPLVIEAASATQFSLDHTKNVNRGMDSKFAKGGCNYKVPQGYRNGRHPLNSNIGTIEKDPQRYDLIRKGWDMFLTGAYTPVQVIQVLNDVWGYRTKQTKKLASASLGENYGYSLFSNPFYAGYVRQNGKLVRITEVEPMVTPDEFSKAQEMLKGHKTQAYRSHEYPYTGLMLCGYCGKQITGEKKNISTGVWENYHCSDPMGGCTKKGMARAAVESKVIEALESITIDEELCQIALRNICRELDSQTGKVSSLYEQQNQTLVQLESRLSNLADMWISGLMKDERLYKEKEEELTGERNGLVIKVDGCRTELEKMRANAIAASNYIVFARDNFMVAKDRRKREIAHALGTTYTFYGKEKEIEITVDPLLVEVVKYAKEVRISLALEFLGSDKQKIGTLQPEVLPGGPEETRTPYLGNANAALYQMSYRPISEARLPETNLKRKNPSIKLL
jgi:site-specific DNA recombinase